MSTGHMQIGEVADRTSLSLRTIRYYEEVALVPPSGRTPGGFRLYTEADVARLMVVKQMKPLDFTLDEMRDLLEVLDDLERAGPPATDRSRLVERLSAYRQVAEERVAALRAQLETAGAFAADLRQRESAAAGTRASR